MPSWHRAQGRGRQKATNTIPIVITFGDPIGQASRQPCAPGGNVTGLSSFDSELGGKKLELLKEAFPAFPALLFSGGIGAIRRVSVKTHSCERYEGRGRRIAGDTSIPGGARCR